MGGRGRIGILGGTGLDGALDGGEVVAVETPWGDVALLVGHLDGVPVAWVARHGPTHDVPPHRVDHRANLWALRAAGCHQVVGVQNVGGLTATQRPGDLVVPANLIDLSGRVVTVFEGPDVVHVDLTEPFCPVVRAALLQGAGDVHDGGVYLQTAGPRLETAAEVRRLASLGDVVGMTAASEATVARELGLCYASLCLVANPAAGLAEGRLAAADLAAAMKDAQTKVLAAVAGSAKRLLDAEVAGCGCAEAPELGRLSP
ncbi:MAG: MTAP family purine nucleoside phosphorylase [Thermoplasmatota archaeon]